MKSKITLAGNLGGEEDVKSLEQGKKSSRKALDYSDKQELEKCFSIQMSLVIVRLFFVLFCLLHFHNLLNVQ